MSRFLVIADDLTGAAEIGAIAVEFGLSAHLGCGQIPKTQSDVLVVDTNTRNLPADEAAAQLTSILAFIDPAQFDLIYKKTDSVLRGPIAAELTTIMNSLGFPRSILIAQNPSRGRVIENGRYLIDGIPLDKTSFATDPEHPARTSDVIELLDREMRFGIRAVRVGTPLGKAGIHIGNGNSMHDVEQWAAELSPQTMPCGGADFFRSILRARGFTPIESPIKLPQSDHVMFVCGSAADESRKFIETIPHSCPMPATLFDPRTAGEAQLDEWRRTIGETLHKSGRVFVTIGHKSIPSRAKHVRQMLSEVTARTLASALRITLFVEGGATAAAILDRLGWKDLAVVGQISPGVSVLTPIEHPSHLLIVKPGSYPWPGALANSKARDD